LPLRDETLRSRNEILRSEHETLEREIETRTHLVETLNGGGETPLHRDETLGQEPET
jgi:hypothetical protein